MRPSPTSILFWGTMGAIAVALLVLMANHDTGQVVGIDNNALSSVVYLGLWGAVLIAGMAAARPRLGETFRAAAIWILLGAVLITLYRYRDTLLGWVSP